MKVRNEVKVYELNGTETKGEQYIVIESHWNYNDRFVFVSKDKDGKEVRLTLIASDVRRAIENATNHK